MCLTDYDCELDHFCWYKTPGDVEAQKKQCIKMYQLKNGQELGYNALDSDLAKHEFKYNLLKNMYIGRACKSGLVSVDKEKNSMKCVEISHVRTNKDNYVSKQESPFMCKLPTNDGFQTGEAYGACKYFYDDGGSEHEIEQEYCECSLMGEEGTEPEEDRRLQEAAGTAVEAEEEEGPKKIPRQYIAPGHGYCPFPNQTVVDRYNTAYEEIIKAGIGVLHTNDRYNLKAQLEMLVISDDAPIANDTWAEVVQTNFEIHNWPYIQSNQTYTCINAVLNYSPMNLFKLDAFRIKIAVAAGLVMTIANIF